MRRHLVLACVTLALASVPSLPSVAYADDAAVAEARARFDEGLELADAGKPEPARLKFQQAYAVFKAPAVLYNLARAEQLTNHDLEALEHFRHFLRLSATDSKVTDAMREKARQNAAAVAQKVGQIEIAVPEKARVAVDGRPLDEMPREPVAVQVGKHTVEATFDGTIKSVTIDCPAGTVVMAKIQFDARTVAPAPSVTESYGAGKWIVPTALGVTGVAAIGFGAIFALSSNDSKSDSELLRRQSPGLCAPPVTSECAMYDSKRSDAESASTMSTVGYVTGGVLLAGAIAAFVLWPRTRGRTAPGLQPVTGAGSLGVRAFGSF